ncbi:MAG: SlyX family protein [Deltaproteobacteria bacterium]|nr:SlyX family protein [Deltaproteobacteria bacterium]
MSDERLMQLEIKLSYAEDLLEKLNGVVTEQEGRISKLESESKVLRNAVKEMRASLPEDADGINAASDPVPSSG